MGEHLIYQIGNLSFNLDTIISMWLCMLVLIIIAYFAGRNTSLIPSKMQLLAEKIVGIFLNLSNSMIGKNGVKHVPFLASLFLFILTANLCGQLPWKILHLKEGEIASSTNDINMTAAMAVLVLVYYTYQGVRIKGIRYFLRSFKFQDIITALIELLEMVVRPFALALRLFVNILAGEILITAFVSIAISFCNSTNGVFGNLFLLLPLPVMFFEILVAFIQATVFMLLSMSYVSLSVKSEH